MTGQAQLLSLIVDKHATITAMHISEKFCTGFMVSKCVLRLFRVSCLEIYAAKAIDQIKTFTASGWLRLQIILIIHMIYKANFCYQKRISSY